MPDLDKLLDTLVADVAAGTRAPGAPRAIKLARRRRWEATAAGGVALAVASTIVAVSLSNGQRSADPPHPADQPGLSTSLVAPASLLDVRELGFHVEPGPDVVSTGGWSIGPDSQSVDVKVFGDGGPTDLQVTVYYQGRSPELPPTGTGEAVTVDGAPGTYFETNGPDSWGAHLVWEYAPNSWAEVSTPMHDGSAPSDLRSRIVTAAEATRSGGEAVRLPIRLGKLPASLPSVAAAHDVSVTFFNDTWNLWLSFNAEIHLWATSETGTDCQGFDGSPYTENFTYRGFEGCLVDGERIGLRLVDGERFALGLGTANAFFDFVDADPGAKPPVDDMKQVLADLTVGSADPATWFDLRTALSGD